MSIVPLRQGKVRDVYDLGDRLLLVASDRISAFDWVLPTAIPDKGRVLTQTSNFWFARLPVAHHLLSTEVEQMDLPWADLPAALTLDFLRGRSVLVKKCEVVPFECVVRGYLVGSGWRDYQSTGTVCGVPLPPGLQCASPLPTAIFTPATKAESGHDLNVDFATMANQIGQQEADWLREQSLRLYQQGQALAATRGIIIADTKFEWGWCDGQLILIDEVMTPDSSRFWPVESYQIGANPPSFDKQFVRDYLEASAWDKNSTPPELPPSIVQQTRSKYIEAYEQLSAQTFAWK